MKKGIYVCCSIYNSPILLLSFYSSPAIFFSVLRNTKIALSCFCLCHSSHTHTHHTCFRYGMTANDRSVSLINVSHQYRSILLLLLFFFSVALRFDLIVIVWCSNCIENSNGSAKMSRTNERKSYTKKKNKSQKIIVCWIWHVLMWWGKGKHRILYACIQRCCTQYEYKIHQ